jgi:hypothetical protein
MSDTQMHLAIQGWLDQRAAAGLGSDKSWQDMTREEMVLWGEDSEREWVAEQRRHAVRGLLRDGLAACMVEEGTAPTGADRARMRQSRSGRAAAKMLAAGASATEVAGCFQDLTWRTRDLPDRDA